MLYASSASCLTLNCLNRCRSMSRACRRQLYHLQCLYSDRHVASHLNYSQRLGFNTSVYSPFSHAFSLALAACQVTARVDYNVCRLCCLTTHYSATRRHTGYIVGLLALFANIRIHSIDYMISPGTSCYCKTYVDIRGGSLERGTK